MMTMTVRYTCEFFFFKQKTAYEMLRSLVGSEMCIRDSPMYRRAREGMAYLPQEPSVFRKLTVRQNLLAIMAVSYTHLTLPTIYSV